MPFDTLTDAAGNPIGVPGNPMTVGGDPRTTGQVSAQQDTVTLSGLDAVGTAAFQISGTWTGTLQFEAIVDAQGPDWVAAFVVLQNTGAINTSTTTNGVFILDCAGYAAVRIRATAAMTGTAFVTVKASLASNRVTAVLASLASTVLDASSQQRLPLSYNNNQIWFPSEPVLFNSVSFDRQRNNTDVIIQASTATGVQTINTDITTYNAGLFLVHINISNFNGGSLTAKLQWKDANGLFMDIPLLTTGALSSGGPDFLLCLGPSVWPTNTATAFYANFPVPRNVRVVQTIATATVTYSAAYSTNCTS